MAYALNTSDTTQKITLSSEGEYSGTVCKPTFNLSSVIDSDPAAVAIVGVETLCMDHPTLFHKNYMIGQIARSDGVVYPITSDSFNSTLQGIYFKPDMVTDSTTLATVDLILYDLLMCLCTATGDNDIIYSFDDETTDYAYCNK